jgi:type I restriction enzyme S subunit
LHELPAAVPPIDVQRKIAAVLSAYDDLIENNRRRIRLLVEMAQRIYREWFVDFRYPGHDMAAFLDSELGPIPDGWQVVTVGDLCERVVDGDWIETKDQGGGDYRLLQVSNIGIGRFRETGNFRYITEETFRRLRCTEVLTGFVLVSRMPAPIGRAWYVDHLDGRAITAVDVAVLEPKAGLATGRFIALSLNTERNLSLAAARAAGTTRPRITRRDLETFPVLMAPPAVLHRFERFLEDAGEEHLRLGLQARILEEARDLLLPRLISGEIDVEDRNIPVDEVAA